MLRKSKREAEQNIAREAKKTPKRFWQYANSNRKVSPGITDLEYVEENVKKWASADSDKANILASFFSSVFTKEPDGNLPEPDPVTITKEAQNIEVTEDVVLKLLLDLDTGKATGPDEMHPFMLKSLAKELMTPLSIIFNKSLKIGKIPDAWKVGSISALFKKGSKTDPGNYRPVSLTSIVCKTMEKIIRNHILDHMTENNLITDYQFGFLPGRSTTLQLLKVLDDWTRTLDNGGQIDAIYMDFMKAFDKVPHRRLVKKLKNYGIHQTAVNWIEDFLTDRKQEVRVNGASSKSHNVTSGIPQGSVLGPILFVVYINDMPNEIKNKIFLFADDTKIYSEIVTDQDQTNLQEDLDKLFKWSEDWLLKFHPNKCKSVSVTRNVEVENTYHLYDENGNSIDLEKTNGEKDIGVLVDNKINFKAHMIAQTNKANSIMGLIRRSFTYLNEENFKLLFKALVRPHLEYAVTVWCPHHKQDVELLENVQRRATRQLSSLRDLSYAERLKRLNLPTLKYRRLRGDMIEVYKIVNGIYDQRVSCNLIQISENTRTRNNTKKIVKRACKKDVRKYFFTQRVVNVWNSLPSEVVTAKSIISFENRLDKFWKNQLVKYEWEAELSLTTGSSEFSDNEEVDVDIVVSSQRP